MSVYGYCRVSTDRQADAGESLGVQERQIEGYAMMRGWAVDRTFVERGVSGSTPLAARLEGAKLAALVRHGDTIVTAKLDRMFRDALNALTVLRDLQARGVSLHMIDLGGDVTNGLSKIMFTIASAFAEGERDRIRERIRDVKRDQQQRGRYLGGPVPIGKRVTEDGRLVELGTGAAILIQVRTLRARGESLRTIANWIEADYGVKLSHESVRKLLAEA